MKSIKKSDIERQYQTHPSLSDHLPWLEWSDKYNMMLLEDGHSVGAALEIRDIPTEAKPKKVIETLHEKVTGIFSSVMPLHDENPWILQFYIQDDLTLEPLHKRLEEYIAQKNNANDSFTKKYLAIMKRHFKTLCREKGLFLDPMSGIPFRGRIRRIRIVLYRRYEKVPKNFETDVAEELKATTDRLISRLKQAGLSVRRLGGKQLYEWFIRWFNPSGNEDKLLEKFPYPEKTKPFGWSFSQNVFLGSVESYDEGWIFDGIKHKILVFNDLQNPIDIGVISRERDFGGDKQKYALLDKFPAGSIYTIQIVFESKKHVKRHLNALEKAAVGKNSIIKDILKNIEHAHHEIHENNNMLFRCVEAVYIRGETNEELKQIELDLKSLLEDSGLNVIDSKNELYPIDTYLRFLPFNFSYQFDRKNSFRSTYKYADDVVRLLPIYGRSRGDGINPLFIYYNRGGEPFIFDPLSKHFKMSNSHIAIIGTTGAGKSVTLSNLCMTLSAVYNPRIIALEVGDSFGLTAKYLQANGRNVSTMKFERQNPISVNPYVEAYKALEIVEYEERILKKNTIQKGGKPYDEGIIEAVLSKHTKKIEDELQSQSNFAEKKELECNENRDILNEMVMATRIMITGGFVDEEKKISRGDVTLISRGLIHAMKRCRKAGIPQMLVQHVAESFDMLAAEETNDYLQSRLKTFAMNLDDYQKGMKARFINRPSQPLGDYDFLQVDFGFMQSERYKDLMNVVCISLLSKILALAEKNKASKRPMILIMDEAHVLFKSSMIAAFITLMAKVARKIGLWLIPCSQNIGDFSGSESRKVLSMMETWLCLALDREELEHVEKFKPLTDEMRALILDIKKYQGVYAEGVLLGKRYSGLFRNVPPRISLSLAMTEQDERTERETLRREKGLTELEAVEHIAEKLENVDQTVNEDEDFYA